MDFPIVKWQENMCLIGKSALMYMEPKSTLMRNQSQLSQSLQITSYYSNILATKRLCTADSPTNWATQPIAGSLNLCFSTNTPHCHNFAAPASS